MGPQIGVFLWEKERKRERESSKKLSSIAFVIIISYVCHCWKLMPNFMLDNLLFNEHKKLSNFFGWLINLDLSGQMFWGPSHISKLPELTEMPALTHVAWLGEAEVDGKIVTGEDDKYSFLCFFSWRLIMSNKLAKNYLEDTLW